MKSAPKDWGLLAVGLSFVGLSLWRASTASLTHDEATTFTYAVLPGIRSLLHFQFVDAGNHLLNSLLMVFTCRLFGAAEWSLRLPNLLAHVVYVFVIWNLLREWGAPARWSSMVLLNAPLLLLNYFAMARGYGLAMCFTAVSIYWLLSYLRKEDVWRLCASQLSALIAATAHFSFVVVFPLCWLVSVCLFVRVLKRIHGWPALSSLDLIGVLGGLCAQIAIGLFLIGPLMKLRANKSFYIGGHAGFVPDTVFSLVYGAVGWPASTSAKIVTRALPVSSSAVWMGTLVGLGLLALVVAEWIHARSKLQRAAQAVALSWLVGAGVLVVGLHVFLDVLYPVQRAAVYFYLLAGLVLALSRWLVPLRVAAAAGLLLALLMRYDARAFTYVEFDRDVKTAVRRVAEDSAKRGQSIRLATDWCHAPAIRHYQNVIPGEFEFEADRTGYPGNRAYYEDSVSWYDPHRRRVLRENYNYAYVAEENLDILKKYYRVDVIETYPVSKTVLCHLEAR